MLTRYDSTLTSPLTLWDSFRLLDDLPRSSSTSNFDVETTADGLTLTVELPGARLEDLSLITADREVTVAGKRRGKEFKHTYVLSKVYDSSTADATLIDGVLTIKFLKSQSARSRTVTIKSG